MAGETIIVRQGLRGIKGDKGDPGPAGRDGTGVVPSAGQVVAGTGSGSTLALGANELPIGDGTNVTALSPATTGGLFETLAGARHHRAHTAITVAASGSPAWMKRLADYVCDGTADDVEIQAAINEAQGYTTIRPQVILLPGTYNLAAQVTWGDCDLIGVGGTNAASARVLWAGAAGATVVTKTNSGTGMMRNVNFRGAVSGGNLPATYIDFTAIAVDKFCRLDTVGFAGGSGPQIKVGNWYNLHWNDLRFDSWGTYAIDLAPGASPFLDSFVIDRFTADSGIVNGTGTAFIRLTFPGTPGNIGAFRLANGRIEKNAQLAANPSLIEVDYSGAATGSNGGWAVTFDNVTFQNVAGGDGVPLFRRSSGGTAGWENAVGINSSLQCSQIGAGDFIDGAAAMPTDAIWTVGRQTASRAAIMKVKGTSYSGVPVHFSVGVVTDTQDWFVATGNNKKLNLGPGGATATDTTLYRSAANRLKTDGDFELAAHLRSSGSAPTIAAGTGAGTSPTVSISGADMAGTITVTTGTSPAASATVATITFTASYGTTPKSILIDPCGVNSAALTGTGRVYEDQASRTATAFVLKVGSTALAASTTYLFAYQVIG